MIINQKILAVVIIWYFFSAGKIFAQGIHLTEYPFKIVTSDELVKVKWAEPIQASLYFSTHSGSTDHTVPGSTLGKIEFVPANVGMAAGIYYCVVSNGLLHSREFPIYVESQQAPNCVYPQNGETIATVSPKFQWDAVVGVPFYQIVVSDQPVTLKKDELGELLFKGANIIYSAITDRTEIYYGAPDPSGFFNQNNGIIPPLLNSKTYNWIVLNNYGNNPALTSIVQSGFLSFKINVPINLLPPSLNAPASNSPISSREIEFVWQPVTNADSYLLEIFELFEEAGSTSTFPVWQVVTSATSLKVPARTIFKNTYYEWHVIALDATGKGAVSPRWNFTYVVPNGTLILNTFTSAGNSLARVNVKIEPLQGGGDNTEYSTTNSGSLSLNVQPGSYQLTFSKLGFRDTLLTSDIEVNKTTELNIYMKLVQSAVIGSVVDLNGSPVSNAQITASDLYQRNQNTMVCDFLGKFQFPLSPSIYELVAFKSGYFSSDTIQITLDANVELILSSPLKLLKNNSMLLGKVTDQNGFPLYGTLVKAINNSYQVSARTDNSGAFQLALGSGTWQLICQKAGYSQDNPRSISINENQTITLSPNLILNSQGASISGIITDGQTGIGQVAINVVSATGSIFSTFSNPKGQFDFTIPAGAYDIFLSHPEYIVPLPQHFNLLPNQKVDNVVFVLQPALCELNGIIRCNGNPVHKAIITNGSIFDTTRIDGSFTLKLSAGTHQLYVTKAGYFQSGPKIVTVLSGEIKSNLDIELSLSSAVVIGRVIGGGYPIVFADLWAIQNFDTVITRSIDNGEFTFSLAPGIWKITARREGYQENSLQNIALQAGQIFEGIEIVLSSNGGTITGKITDAAGKNISQANVACQERGVQAFTDNSGNYEIKLSAGNVLLSAFKAGYNSQTKNVTVASGQSQAINFTISNQGSASGKITDAAGVPINLAEVLAVQNSDTTTTYSDYAGEYVLFLVGGNYTLQGDKLGYAKVQQQITIQAGQTIIKNIQLPFKPEEIARVIGLITVDNKYPLPEVLIKISGKKNKTTQTGIDGIYEVPQLETGYNYKILPWHKSHFFFPTSRIYNLLSENKMNQNFVATLYGDLSNNQEVSSFDGSLVLRIAARKNIFPYFTLFPRDSLAADVSGNKAISSFDASLIFRYTVGLISSFPVQEPAAGLPKINMPEPQPVYVYFRPNWMDEKTLNLAVLNSDLPAFYSLDAQMKFLPHSLKPISLSPCDELKSFFVDWNSQDNNLYLALAGTQPAHCADTLFTMIFQKTENEPTPNLQFLITNLELDETPIPVFAEQNPTVPNRFFVSQNYPNPFNAGTMFKIWLPKLAENDNPKLQVEIYNILGQKIKTIIHQDKAPGYYSLRWSGDSDSDFSVTSGIYLLKVKYAHIHEIKKMILVR